MPQNALVTGLSHIGIRVHDFERSRAFYERLGFAHAWGPLGSDQVAGLRHPSGVEINFIVTHRTPRRPTC